MVIDGNSCFLFSYFVFPPAEEHHCNDGSTHEGCDTIDRQGALKACLGQEDPWRRVWQPTPVFLPGESHGQRSLMGYSPWGLKELDMTAQLSTQDRKSTRLNSSHTDSSRMPSSACFSAYR